MSVRHDARICLYCLVRREEEQMQTELQEMLTPEGVGDVPVEGAYMMLECHPEARMTVRLVMALEKAKLV